MTLWKAICFFLFSTFFVTVQSFSVHEMNIDEYLQYVNPPAVEKYQDGFGNTILCVSYPEQPLETRKNMGIPENAVLQDRKVGTDAVVPGNASISGEKACPDGKVGIRETKREAVENAGSVAQYVNQFRGFLSRGLNTSRAQTDYLRHQAVAEYYTPDNCACTYGTYGEINIWQPFVASDGHFSDGHVIVAADMNYQEVIEAGWHVYPQKYGDGLPRFYTTWSADNYVSTGCRDTDCEGFVLLYPSSDYKKPLHVSEFGAVTQWTLNVKIERAIREGSIVWNVYSGNILIGYWPGNLFKKLISSATVVEYGGLVASQNKKEGERISKTDMGSGRFPQRGYTKAAFIGNIQLNGQNGLPLKMVSNDYATNRDCYDVELNYDDRYKNHLFFGGPGGDQPGCENY